MGYRKLEMESDSLETVSVITRPCYTQHNNALVVPIWEISLYHVRRLQNAAADIHVTRPTFGGAMVRGTTSNTRNP
ncbi:hypothetical protein V6N13_036315 [Hibiscus sabdariffa]